MLRLGLVGHVGVIVVRDSGAGGSLDLGGSGGVLRVEQVGAGRLRVREHIEILASRDDQLAVRIRVWFSARSEDYV